MKKNPNIFIGIRLGLLVLIVLGLFLAFNPETTKAAIHATATFYTWTVGVRGYCGARVVNAVFWPRPSSRSTSGRDIRRRCESRVNPATWN